MTNKKLAKLQMSHGRIITAYVTEPISMDYYDCQIVQIENPIVGDWEINNQVKISKEIVKQFKFI